MAQDTFNYVTNAIVTVLRANVVDPASRGTNWIYPVMPSVGGNFPKIEVSLISATSATEQLGNASHIYRMLYQITVWVKKGEIYGGRSNSLLCEYLASQVTNVFETKKETFTGTYQIRNPLLEGLAKIDFDEETNLFTFPITMSMEYLQIR